MSDHSFKLDQETECYCSLHMFTKVTNTAEILEKLIANELQCCMANVTLVSDIFQVVVAANKAALNAKRNVLVTKNVHTEVLYAMSVSKNISRSLAKFGISKNDKNILVILIHKHGEEDAMLKQISKNIKGNKVPISTLQEFTDIDRIKEAYNICDEELQNSDIVNSVVSRISFNY